MYLKQIDQPGDKMLVHWTYTREEWGNFIRQVVSQQNPAYRFIRRFVTAFRLHLPEVWISQRQVWVGNKEKINTSRHQLQQIDLKEEGSVNILLICYRKKGKHQRNIIKIPIPKGKLREAIVVQEKMVKQF